MDDILSRSRSFDNILTSADEEFLNMLLSNSSITDVVEPANNISSSNLQLSGDKSQLPNFDATTNTFFFNADAKEQEQTQTTTTLSETADTGPPLPMVNIKSEEEPYIELPDIFPSIEEIGTQASLEEPIQPVASAAKKKETKIQMPAPKKQQTVKKEQQPTEKKRNPQNKKTEPESTQETESRRNYFYIYTNFERIEQRRARSLCQYTRSYLSATSGT
jgi:outer membrane biosynthesis protein TonB